MNKGTFLFAVPTLFFATILMYLLLWNVYYSFTNWSLFLKPTFVGFATYKSVVDSFLFRNAFIHSFEVSASLVLLGNLVGLFFAGLLYFVKNNRLRITYMSLFVYPLSISMASNGLIFLWLFNTQIGVNWLLKKLSLPTYPWFNSSATILPSLIVIMIWAYSGIAMLFYLASFLNVDKSIVESARIDGANSIRIFGRILLPNSLNGFIVSTALLFLFSFRMFTLPFVISGGPTNTNLMTLLIYQYRMFGTSYFANSSVAAAIIVLIAVIIVIPYALLGMRRWVHH